MNTPKFNANGTLHWGFCMLVCLTFFASGCSLCCNPYVDDYSTFGSRTPRVDMKHGRVGSVFSDPNIAQPSNIVTMDEYDSVSADSIDEESEPVEIVSVERR